MRLGVIGGGQLGRMLGEAALPLGISCVFLDPAERPSAAAVGEVIRAPHDDAGALEALARRVDVLTYELEGLSVDAARKAQAHAPVHPAPDALATAQDRLVEKTFFHDHGIDTAPFRPVSSLDELRRAVADLGLPALLKTRRFGYDGKGQQYLVDEDQAEPAFRALGRVPCLLERVVPFDREVSVLAARGTDGDVVCWPLVENRHAGGILRWSLAAAPGVDADLQARAEAIARRVLDSFGYVGVLAVELFQVGDRLLANEMAPRVHNSGHWTIEGAHTSQFENHVRAVLGLPLGETRSPLPCGCVNLLGHVPPLSELLSVPGASVHLYDKVPRPGRKMGHVTLRGADFGEVRERFDAIRRVMAE